MGKLLSGESLEDFARQVARLHRPLRRDWGARFGLGGAPTQPVSTTSPTSLPPCDASKDDAGPVDGRTAIPVVSPKPEMLSTSKLGAAMGLPNAAATLERLRAAGYLERIDGSDRLTEKGRRAGGQFVEKSRFGPYFAWPGDLRC